MPPRRSGSSNLFAVFAHLGCFFFPILVPLVIYLLTKDEPGEQFAAGNARGIIIAAIKAANGQIWRYPLTLRLIK